MIFQDPSLEDMSTKYPISLSEFENITGVPVVLNTSFNLNGEPIVCSPTDAIKTFYSCGMDALIMGNYIVHKLDGYREKRKKK